jgi:Uma2 family endonuclease
MNQPFLPSQFSRLTQAAEGLLRWRWTVAEIEAMTKAGIFMEDERFELIGGEIVPMNPKGIQHEVVKLALSYHFFKQTPAEFQFITETTFRMNEDTFVEPDFIFFRKSDGLANLTPRTALLAVEVAASSLAWDLGRKARLYANFGIPELWVIEAQSRLTHVHKKPGLEGYGEIRQVPEDQALSPGFAPEITVTLAKLDYS